MATTRKQQQKANRASQKKRARERADSIRALGDSLKRINPDKPVRLTEEVERLRKLPYASYLKSYWWWTMKQKAIKKADNRCMVCYGDQNLHVHHRTYERRGNEKISDLTVLCKECHGIFHREGRLSKH